MKTYTLDEVKDRYLGKKVQQKEMLMKTNCDLT